MVTVRSHDADRYLASPPDHIRLFLIHGSDAGAITERARLLERVALMRGKGDEVFRIGSDELSSNPGRVADEAYAASLFGGEPVIALRVLDGRHNVAGALEPLFERPPDAAWLVVEAAELSPSSPLRKAFETSKHAAAIPSYPLEGSELSALIHAAVEEAEMTIDHSALELLLENLGGDRLAIRGELEKLFLYLADQKTVTFDAVEAIVGDTTTAKTDHAIDAALLGDNEALELALSRLRAEGASPSALGALALRHLLQLQTLRAAVDAGERPARVVDFARPPIFGRRRPNVEAEIERWPSTSIAGARRRIDRAVMLMRLQPALEDAAISEALHDVALEARRLKRGARD
jgi:DNA polymerase III subunit delta